MDERPAFSSVHGWFRASCGSRVLSTSWTLRVSSASPIFVATWRSPDLLPFNLFFNLFMEPKKAQKEIPPKTGGGAGEFMLVYGETSMLRIPQGLSTAVGMVIFTRGPGGIRH